MHSSVHRSALTGVVLLLLPMAFPVWAANYFPLLTQPEWEQSTRTIDSSGMEILSRVRNLLEVSPIDGSIITPVLSVISSGNVLIEDDALVFDPFGENYRTLSVTAHDVLPTAIDTMESNWAALDFDSKQTLQTTDLKKNSVDFWATDPSRLVTKRGVPFIRPEAEIGRVYTHSYRVDSKGETDADPGPGYLKATIETTSYINIRTVYAGVDRVDTLYPGADITEITGAYQALVVIQELDTESTTTTTIDGMEPLVNTHAGSSTSIQWLVDNFGLVKSITALGPYLNELLSGPVFNSGDGITSVGGLDAVIPPELISTTTLRRSGGNKNAAVDADISTGRVQLYDYSTFTWIHDDPGVDMDGDGVVDGLDAFPRHAAASVDSDGDGKPDQWHADCDETCQTNSGLYLDRDDDNDTLPDTWETSNDTDPLVADADQDLDGDGYTNLEEYQAGTAANDPQDLPLGWWPAIPYLLDL